MRRLTLITLNSTTTAAALQAVVNNAAAGETIVLAAGTYTFDRTVVVNRDDISIVGAGSDETRIELTGAARSSGAFQIGSVIDQPAYGDEFKLASGASQGSTTLVLQDAGGLSAGDHLWIERPNTDAYLDSIGDTIWREDKPLRTSLVEVAKVEGNVVTLSNALAFDFAAGDAIVQTIEMAENVTLGGFSIDSGLGESDPSKFLNVNAAFDRDNGISASATSNLKHYDIAITEAPSNGFTFAQSVGVTATGLSVDGAHNKGDGGNGYAFQLRALYDSTLTDLSAFDTRHAVLFASWTSEAYNRVEVSQTNRDINFHGGPDHDNFVTVLQSTRTEVEADYMSPTLTVNSAGASYGAPTAANANTVQFGVVYGTDKAETLVALATGSEFHARAGQDLLIGGVGNDKLYGDKSDDKIYGSGGKDILDGGVGTDLLRYFGDASEFAFARDSQGRLVVIKEDGYDVVTAIERLVFDDSSIATSSLTPRTTVLFGTDGADTITVGQSSDLVLSGAGYDRILSAQSYVLGAENEALDLEGTAAIDGTGNALANALRGNDAANQIAGLSGDDRLYGRGGDDLLQGGDGEDELYGQSGADKLWGGNGDDLLNGSSGNDWLSGGLGHDRLQGGAGADTFVFGAGVDSIDDFLLGQGDRLSVGDFFSSAADFRSAFLAAAQSGGDTLSSLGLDVETGQDAAGSFVRLEARAADGSIGSIDLHGATLEALIAANSWYA